MKSLNLTKYAKTFPGCTINMEQELDITTAVTVAYSFTMRKTTNPDSTKLDDYFKYINRWRAKGVILDKYVCEYNNTNKGYHLHGVFLIPKKFNMKQFRVRGFHMKLDEIYDKVGWDAYMSKQQILEQEPVGDNMSSDKEVDTPIDPDFIMPTKRLFK